MKSTSGSAATPVAALDPNPLAATRRSRATPMCPGAQKLPDPVDQHAAKIRGQWQKSVELILETAKACAAAWDELLSEDRRRLLKKLHPDISRETFSKLTSVGRNKALHAAEIRKRLPSNWTILHKLRNFTEEELTGAIEAGVLSKKCSRAAIEEWIAENTQHGRKRKYQQPDPEEEGRLKILIDTLLADEKFIARWRESPASVRARLTRSMMHDAVFA